MNCTVYSWLDVIFVCIQYHFGMYTVLIMCFLCYNYSFLGNSSYLPIVVVDFQPESCISLDVYFQCEGKSRYDESNEPTTQSGITSTGHINKEEQVTLVWDAIRGLLTVVYLHCSSTVVKIVVTNRSTDMPYVAYERYLGTRSCMMNLEHDQLLPTVPEVGFEVTVTSTYVVWAQNNYDTETFY